ncbi:MAG: PEP/pyruvate-binding domain-containing protein [Thermodesulfobacteriota bacterium]|nr:PEP/pyruvate-binding domain-containing protein [Thermodesulfobacteriota bacterium]
MEKIIAKSGVELLVEKRIMDDWVEISIGLKDNRKCLLHWGLCHHVQTSWEMPPGSVWPEGSQAFGQQAIQTPFSEKDGVRQIVIRLDRTFDFSFLVFVLYFPKENSWDNNLGRNYRIPLAVPSKNEVSLGRPELTVIANEIIEKEMSRNSWTLMHRFNLCYGLLDRVGNNMDGLALMFVWLRFSTIRQLDWQRNYNTQPRELSHAEDRLTLKLADYYTKEKPEGREYIRLMLTTMGRGGEGQRIRDEVLNIMHRLHIKEVSGHFMEEWHQKLHNNTTPDDVVICEAYLGFLKNNGNLDLFYKILDAGRITKQRLESFERPIISHPDFVPSIKDPLIHELEHFLGILKAVHSGTDLGTAIYAARYLFDSEMHGLMDFIWAHRDNTDACMLIEKITEARRRFKTQLQGSSNVVRDMLFLDLALENFLRVVVERSLHLHLSADQLVELIAMVLENLLISKGNDEFTHCLHQWEHVKKMPYAGKDWALQSRAVLDRLSRALGTAIDRYYQVLQPKAEFLGRAFHAESWAVSLFSEEVVRGKPIFALSMLLRQIDPILRRDAHLGSWQVISRGQGTGQVEVVSELKSVQGKDFAQPTVIVADKIAGEEEIPKEVIAVITPDLTDIVSHVAIRARNANVLFAVCYDPDIIGRLRSCSGHLLSLSVNAAGDVIFKEGSGEPGITAQPVLPIPRISRPCFTAYAVSSSKFNQKIVGGKSNNLRHLQGKLPEWIDLPGSVAMPFGVFEKVLAEKNNKEIAKNYNELILQIDKNADKVDVDVLSELRKTILGLKAPDELVSELHGVMDEAGLPWPSNWEDAWTCIKRVWGSKWNERAHLSRKTRGIPHAYLFMAVLIQEVVKADYSFVIHTVNPSTGNRNEIYAEVVPGLGETLVGNYPGKALSFTCRKGKDEPQLLAFPSKSVALFGSGLIFRSDSNGEDMVGYAGAGLYDSIMLEPSVKVSLDYTRESLVGNKDFRKDFLVTVADIGTVIEKAMGFPQDIEGAYSKGQYYVVQTRPQVGSAESGPAP